MLDLKNGANIVLHESPAPYASVSAADSFTTALGVIRRQAFPVAALAVLGAACGIAHFISAPETYTASAELLVDTGKIEIFQQPAVAQELSMQSAGAMESQVELLKSEAVALRVVRTLNLARNPRFMSPRRSLLRPTLYALAPQLFPLRPEPTDEEREVQALDTLDRNLTIQRVGVTYAIEIRYQAGDPALAAEVTNAVADAYVDLRRSSEYDAAKRASDWFETRIPELRAKSEAAQQTLVDYKREHNLVETDKGQLIDDQRLLDINQKMTEARDETLKAKARYDQLVAATAAGVRSAVSGVTRRNESSSDSLDKLRDQYQEVATKEAEAATRLGANNLTILALRNQKAQLSAAIDEEIRRLRAISQSDYEAARSREATLRKEFDADVVRSQAAKDAQVKMRDLEATARAYQDLYNTFVDRYNASLQQAISPVSEATVITAANPHIKRDYKGTIQVAAMFPVAGLMFGVAFAFLREMLGGRVFLTSRSVQARLQIPCVGLLPRLRPRRRLTLWPHRRVAPDGPRAIARGDREIAWTVVDHPYAPYSEGIRSLKLAIDLDRRSSSSRVVGVTSTSPDEGKSTVALSLAQLIASNGASVILVDADIRNPSLTRSLTRGATLGVTEAALGGATLENALWSDPGANMAFLPAIANAGPPDPPSVLSSPGFSRLFDDLRGRYQFVIVDLSPLSPVIDVCATTELIDAYVLVIEWGRTTIDNVQNALRAAPTVADSVVGAVLNKVDLKALAAHDPYMSSYSFHKGAA